MYKSRTRSKDESLPKLAQAIRRLTCYALPGVVWQSRHHGPRPFHWCLGWSRHALEHEVYQSRPKTLDEALTFAVELEAFLSADQQRGRTARAARASPDSTAEQKSYIDFRRELQEIKDLLVKLAVQKSGRTRRPDGCWSCGDKNHLARSCPTKQQKPSGNGQQPSSRAWAWLLLLSRGPYNPWWKLVWQKTVRTDSSLKAEWRACLTPS